MIGNNGNGFSVARVVAVLDASCADVESVTTATELAARLGAEVMGLFIEDLNLVRMATLPAARHIGIGMAVSTVWDIDSLEREMQVLAARAEAELGALATRIGVKWSFRVVRGLPAAELETATVMQDLLVLGSARPPVGLPLRFGSPILDAVRHLARTVLLVPRLTTLARPLVVVRAGSERTARALSAGARLARGRDLDIMLVGDPAAIASAGADIDAWVRAREYTHHMHTRAALTGAHLVRLCQAFGSDVLVLTADLPLIDVEGGIDELAQAAFCHVLVVQ